MPLAPQSPTRAMILVALMAAAAIAACDTDNAIDPAGNRYVEGVAGSWQRVNPLFVSANEVDRDLSRLVFSGLTRIEPDGRVAPDLAESWEIIDGGETYVFHLRDDVQWHDGAPLRSRDVAFTIEQILDPGFRGDTHLTTIWDGVTVETPDDLTVTFRLPAPNAPFLARQTPLGILPEHLLAGTTGEAMFNSPFNIAPVGTGPYRVVSLTQERAIFAAHTAYHLGTPSIPALEMRFYSDYPAARRAFESGDVNGLMIREASGTGLAAEVNAVSGADVTQPQRGAYVVLYLNNDHVPFDDPAVRKAISLAIDRRAIVDGAFGGIATASSSPITPGSWAYDGEYDLSDRDVEGARELLASAGWTPGAAGVMTKAGSELRFTIRTDEDPTRRAVAGLIQSQLNDIGIRATVQSMSFSVLLRDFLRLRNYEAAVALWDQGPDPDPYSWHRAEFGPEGLNIANTEEAVLDSLIAEARTETDEELRADYYHQFQEVWQEMVPSAIIAYPRYVYAQSGSVDRDPLGILFTAAERFAQVFRWTL